MGLPVGSEVSVSYKGYRFPAEAIGHAVWLYHRFPLSYREVEELLFERGITVSYQHVLAAHHAHRNPRSSPPGFGLPPSGKRGKAREPEHLFGDGPAVMEELRERVARQGAADTTRARALRRLAHERARLPAIYGIRTRQVPPFAACMFTESIA